MIEYATLIIILYFVIYSLVVDYQVPDHMLKFVGRCYLGEFGSMALGMRVGE